MSYHGTTHPRGRNVPIEELDHNIAISSRELPFYSSNQLLEEYLYLKTIVPTMEALDEMERRHPELHKHTWQLVTTGNRRFVDGEVDDNLIDRFMCTGCGIERAIDAVL